MAEITHICKRSVLSTKPIPAGSHHNLSILDRLMEKKHLKIVLYYQSPAGATAITGEATRRLRESLSETLNDFPMVSGRLVKNEEGKWRVKCNDAGVRMVEARAQGSVDEWLRIVDGEMEMKLVHWEEMLSTPYFWSTFYVQVTEFEGGGFAVGLSCSHLLADPICATMFLKAWADSTSAQNIIRPSIFHPQPRPIHETQNNGPNNSLINYYKSSMEKPPPTPITRSEYKTIALAFSDDTVRACMAMAQDGGPLKSGPSPFAALAGLFWACISKFRGNGKGEDGFVKMSICLDGRKVLKVGNHVFGNFMVYNAVEVDDWAERSISTAVQAVAEVVASMEDKENILELINWLQYNDNQQSTLNNGFDLICMNLEELEEALFENDIKPIKTSYYVEPIERGGQILVISQLKSSEEPQLRRVVVATLENDEVAKLLVDELILSLRPTILYEK